jgi:hypothetical protein
MRFSPLALFAVAVAVSPWSASALSEGVYKGRGAGSRLEATVRKIDDGSYTLEVSTIGTYVDGIGGRCTGTVSATGHFNADRSRIIAVAVDPDLKTASAEEVCVLVGDFGGARLRIESWGCTTFHGAKCGFDGRLKRMPAQRTRGRGGRVRSGTHEQGQPPHVLLASQPHPLTREPHRTG